MTQFIAAKLSPDTERVVYPMPFPPDVSQGTRQLIIADGSKIILAADPASGEIKRNEANQQAVGTFKPGTLFYDYTGKLWRVI